MLRGIFIDLSQAIYIKPRFVTHFINGIGAMRAFYFYAKTVSFDIDG